MTDDSHSEPSQGDATASSSSGGEHRLARWVRVGRLLAPPFLAAAAVGMHFALNVPSAEVRQAIQEDAKARAEKKAATPAKPRPKPRENDVAPRSDAELARLVKTYAQVEWEEEPIVASWARRHQSLVNQAVVVARKHAFEGAPEEPRVIVTGTRCRTVRCRFMLRSPYPHELELLDRTLQQVHDERGPLWRAYAAERIEAPKGAPPTDSFLQVTVAFASDEPDRHTFVVRAEPADEDEPADSD